MDGAKWSRWIAALLVVSHTASLCAQPSNEEMNASNNPLTPSLGLNLQDQYTDSFYGLDDADSNAALLRASLPHKLFGMPQLLRVTLPVVTSADVPPTQSHTDLGDLNVFDILLFKRASMELGIGPQLTAPTAGRDDTGTGKWQAGLALLAVAPQKWGLIGGLVTWQHSFAGDDERRTQNNLQAQPFVIYNMPGGWYLRSTATWSWDLELGTHFIPIGLGLGKVWKGNGTTYNLFAEPQWTVLHAGDGVPRLQFYAGLNLQFPLGHR